MMDCFFLNHEVRNAAAFTADCIAILAFFRSVDRRAWGFRHCLGWFFLLLMLPLFIPGIGIGQAIQGNLLGFLLQSLRMLMHWSAVCGYLFCCMEYNLTSTVYWSGFITAMYLEVQVLRTSLLVMVRTLGAAEQFLSITTYVCVLAEWGMIAIVIHQVRPIELQRIGHGRWIQLFLSLFLQIYIKWSLIVLDNASQSSSIQENAVLFAILAAIGVDQCLVSYEVSQQMKADQIRLRVEQVSLGYEVQNAKRALQTNNDMRRLYHDMENHLLAIQSMAGEGQNLQSYLKELLHQFEGYDSQVNTGNTTVDALLSEKIRRAALDGISFHIQLDISALYFVKMVDLVTIFGNAVDNAIEAVRMLPEQSERYIYIKSILQANMMVLRFENPYVGEIVRKGAQLMTGKESSTMHGIGLNSIETVASRYNGSIHTKFEGTDHWFVLTVLLPLQ